MAPLTVTAALFSPSVPSQTKYTRSPFLNSGIVNESVVATLSANGLHVICSLLPRVFHTPDPNSAILLALTNSSPSRFTSQSLPFVANTPPSQTKDATRPASPGIGFSASTTISFRPAFSATLALVGFSQPS